MDIFALVLGILFFILSWLLLIFSLSAIYFVIKSAQLDKKNKNNDCNTNNKDSKN